MNIDWSDQAMQIGIVICVVLVKKRHEFVLPHQEITDDLGLMINH